MPSKRRTRDPALAFMECAAAEGPELVEGRSAFGLGRRWSAPVRIEGLVRWLAKNFVRIDRTVRRSGYVQETYPHPRWRLRWRLRCRPPRKAADGARAEGNRNRPRQSGELHHFP